MSSVVSTIEVEFVRFLATDGVELQGWLSEADGEVAAIHIHGMSGNGYENNFLDTLRQMYCAKGISFFSIDTRGRGVITDFRQGDGWKRGGSCFELFDECAYDISGAIEFLRSRGKLRFILQGHSLGCTKAVYFVTKGRCPEIQQVVLLAPTDMVRWAELDPAHLDYLANAQQLLAADQGAELVGAECWADKTPLSAQSYPTLCEVGSSADIYSQRVGGPLLQRVPTPLLIVYGSRDVGILRIDGTVDAWRDRTTPALPANTRVEVVDGAEHGFRGYEDALADRIDAWI